MSTGKVGEGTRSLTKIERYAVCTVIEVSEAPREVWSEDRIPPFPRGKEVWGFNFYMV